MLKSLYETLIESAAYKEFTKQHPKATLSHFFAQLNHDFTKKANWEAGFFDPENKKVTVFLDNAIKMQDDVFAKDTPNVPELKMDDVKITFDDAVAKAKAAYEEHFSSEARTEGFVILQVINGKTLWNFTFISRTLKFLNVRIDAGTGELVSHQAVQAASQM